MVKNNENAIKETAYFMWEAAGRPQGQDEYFWMMASEQFSGKCSSSSCKSNSASSSSSSSAKKSTSTAKKTSSAACKSSSSKKSAK